MSMKSEPVHPPSEELFAYRDGELLHEKRVIIEAHVMGCSLCRTLIDQVSSLEGELRQSPDRSPPHYLEQLDESVRARLKAEGAAAGAVGAGHPARPGGVPARERAAGGRYGRLREAPRLPWAAALSTASAAAMVVVVAVFLVKQGIYQRASTPKLPSRVSQAPVGPPAEERAAGVESVAQFKQEAASRDAAKLDATAKDELTKREGLKAAQKVAKRAPSAMAAPENEASGSLGRVTVTPVRQYDELLSQFGLPPVWNSSVSPEALGRAERALRGLYLTGGAGSDSARVRLYLAEAARLRLAPGDSILYQEIERHYQRAIELAGPDAEAARVAEQRLRSLER